MVRRHFALWGGMNTGGRRGNRRLGTPSTIKLHHTTLLGIDLIQNFFGKPKAFQAYRHTAVK